MTGTAGWVGARPESGGTRFRVWAPERRQVELLLAVPGAPDAVYPLQPGGDGYFGGLVPGVRPGDRYRYRLDGEGPFPDPASRYQPEGVHGPSEVVDPAAFRWTDGDWAGRPQQGLVVYELHVGTFTPEGTFAAATARLPYLNDLGVTAVELMPVADFPGGRNWGYDGVALYAPSGTYGTPDDLRRLVDTAHALGLAVLLDVVYNHLGPDGNYLGAFSPYYFSSRHRTPWGDAVNYDGDRSGPVRGFVTGNAEHWIREYHMDGLRLDATHAILDDGPRHILADIAEAARRAASGRQVVMIAEDNRNLDRLVRPTRDGGDGLDGVWSDDFHHIVRRLLAGDTEGYFADFEGTTAEIATALRAGWLFRGQPSPRSGRARGTDPAGIPRYRFVIALQNHDQVGNRACGDRLHHGIDLAAWRAASVLLLTAPETPLLFMGQEWGAGSPFLYFTEHNPELGRLVTEGRRREFQSFRAFADPAAREGIPDPQSPETFRRSRLDWHEAAEEPHASLLRLYRDLLSLRRETAAWFQEDALLEVRPLGSDGLCLWRQSEGHGLLVVVRLRGAGLLELPSELAPAERVEGWHLRLDSELYAPDQASAPLDFSGGVVRLQFPRPGGVILEQT